MTDRRTGLGKGNILDEGEPLSQRLFNALNKLAKWRSVFAGWQLGTRAATDPECQAVRDHREVTILLRAEVTALTNIIRQKGLATEEEIQAALLEEAQLLDKDFEKKFPGATTSEIGVHFDNTSGKLEWMKNWRP